MVLQDSRINNTVVAMQTAGREKIVLFTRESTYQCWSWSPSPLSQMLPSLRFIPCPRCSAMCDFISKLYCSALTLPLVWHAPFTCRKNARNLRAAILLAGVPHVIKRPRGRGDLGLASYCLHAEPVPMQAKHLCEHSIDRNSHAMLSEIATK
jgi:hypothetical protein